MFAIVLCPLQILRVEQNQPVPDNVLAQLGKRVVKDFRGNDSTKAAIEASKKLKGTTRYLLLTERSIKILKSDGKVGENRFF